MIIYNTNTQESGEIKEQLYELLADIFISQEESEEE